MSRHQCLFLQVLAVVTYSIPLAQPALHHLDLVGLRNDDILAQTDQFPVIGLFETILHIFPSIIFPFS